MAKKKGFKVKNENRLGYMFMAPWITGFIIFTLFPFVYTIYLSFCQVKLSVMGWEINWTGADNYVTALFKNTEFVPAIITFATTLITYVPTIGIISFILALSLNVKLRLRLFFRTVYFLPVIVLSGPVMYKLMDTGSARGFSLEGIFIYNMIKIYSPALAEGLTFLFRNFAMILWFTGIPIVLFINGLQKININLLEAASIDGATSWQILWKIIIPIIKPIARVVTLFTIVQLGIFSVNPVFEMILASVRDTVGGLGLATAYSWIYGMLILLFIGVSFIVLRDKRPRTMPEICRRVRR